MARGGMNKGLPSRIYFLKSGGDYYNGPYMNKPTALFKKMHDGEIIVYERDKENNYIKTENND